MRGLKMELKLLHICHLQYLEMVRCISVATNMGLESKCTL